MSLNSNELNELFLAQLRDYQDLLYENKLALPPIVLKAETTDHVADIRRHFSTMKATPNIVIKTSLVSDLI